MANVVIEHSDTALVRYIRQPIFNIHKGLRALFVPDCVGAVRRGIVKSFLRVRSRASLPCHPFSQGVAPGYHNVVPMGLVVWMLIYFVLIYLVLILCWIMFVSMRRGDGMEPFENSQSRLRIEWHSLPRALPRATIMSSRWDLSNNGDFFMALTSTLIFVCVLVMHHV